MLPGRDPHPSTGIILRVGKFVPSQGMRSAARRGLELIADGKAGGGFEPATAARARKIAAGRPLTRSHVMRMHSFFSRHAGGRSKTAKPGEVTPWDVAQLAWGGKAGASWAAAQAAKIKRREGKV